MSEFVFHYDRIVLDLENLLKMKFTPGSPDNKTAIGLTLKAIINYHENGDIFARDVLLNRLAMLAKNLREINEFDKNLLKQLRKVIKSSNKIDDFFGIRFEINIAATLIRKGIPFEITESPDFIAVNELGIAEIECTSSRIRKEIQANDDYSYKISSAVLNKSKKAYANRHTALFIDITNLTYATSVADGDLWGLLDREDLAKLAEESEFGNLTIFMYASNKKRGGIESRYMRFDHSKIDQNLILLLDICFPFGEIPFGEFVIPAEG